MTIRELQPPPAPSGPLHRRSSLLPFGLCAGLLLSLSQPLALRADEGLDAAKKLYESGERNYLGGRYWQAAKAFEEAYALSRRGDLLFNAARAYDRGEYAVRAIDAYQGYIDSVPDAADKAEVQKRLVELKASLAKLMITTNEKGFLFVDGHEYSRTPMQQPIDMDSGYHRVEVRQGNRGWSKEQQFSAGQSYRFEADLGEAKTNGSGLNDTIASGEEIHLKPKTRRLAATIGIGGAFDVAGNAFPPHQAGIYLGVDYRALERPFYAIDLVARIPIEVAGGWTNAGYLLGGRVAISPLPRLPLELTAELDVGLAVLSYSSSASMPTATPRSGACDRPSQLDSCILPSFRLHPKLGAAYRITPAFEVRGELFGVEVDLGNPVADPRITVTLAAAYRFF